MLKKILSPLFNKWLEEKKQEETSQLDDVRQTVVETLKTYLKTSHDQLKNHLEKSHDKKSFDISFSIFLEFETLRKQDLVAIRDDLAQLHDLAQKHNVAIEIEGLDNLPRIQLSAEKSFIKNNDKHFNFYISIDSNRPYNYMVNPYKTDQKNPPLPSL